MLPDADLILEYEHELIDKDAGSGYDPNYYHSTEESIWNFEFSLLTDIKGVRHYMTRMKGDVKGNLWHVCDDQTEEDQDWYEIAKRVWVWLIPNAALRTS